MAIRLTFERALKSSCVTLFDEWQYKYTMFGRGRKLIVSRSLGVVGIISVEQLALDTRRSRSLDR